MFEFILPDLGEGIAEGEILKWYGEGFFRSRTSTVYNVFKDDTHRLVEYLKTLEDFRAQGLQVEEISNDGSHKAAAFLSSPYESAAILNVGAVWPSSRLSSGMIVGKSTPRA